jgi:HK97 gp10 family phage protein
MSDNINALLERLDNLTGYVTDAIVTGLHQAGKKIQADAKRICPVDTGQLRESIVEGVEIGGDKISEIIGTRSDHAVYVEFGTGPKGAASSGGSAPGTDVQYRTTGWSYEDKKTGEWRHTNGQPARPFLYPAFKQNEAGVEDFIAKAVKRAIADAGGKKE